MPKPLRRAFVLVFIIGAALFLGSLLLPERGHESYWTTFSLHGVAEFWGFAIGILVAFLIGIKLAEEKITPILEFVAKLREEKVITEYTARGVVNIQ